MNENCDLLGCFLFDVLIWSRKDPVHLPVAAYFPFCQVYYSHWSIVAHYTPPPGFSFWTLTNASPAPCFSPHRFSLPDSHVWMQRTFSKNTGREVDCDDRHHFDQLRATHHLPQGCGRPPLGEFVEICTMVYNKMINKMIGGLVS